MTKLNAEELKPGRFVDRHVFFEGSFIVFPKYQVLSTNDIERIQKFNFGFFHYDESEPPASYERVQGDEAETGAIENSSDRSAPSESPTDEAKETPKAALPSALAFAETPHQRKVVTIYGSIVTLLHKEFEGVARGEKLESARVAKIASIIIEYVTNVKEEAILHVSRGGDAFRLEVHSVNVGILSAILGQFLRIRGADLTNLVTGAVVHDLGIVLIHNRLGDTEHEPELIQEHTTEGFRYLKTLKNLDPTAVMPALQHHEKAYGDGYPKGLALKDMERTSKIVSLCDSFDNQISFIKYGNDPSIHYTKNEFITWKKEDFDQELLGAFIRSMSELFRYHTPVILNDGCLALIQSVSVRFPFAPVVQVIADENGNKTVDQRKVDLRKTKDVWISRFFKKSI